MSEFYVGYQQKAPPGIAHRVRTFLAFLFALAALSAIIFAAVQRTYAPSFFEYGKVRSFVGIISAHPYPTLTLQLPIEDFPARHYFLLVAEGKHGADSQVVPFDGKSVSLRGTLIYRDSQAMIEIVNGSIQLRTSMPVEAMAEDGPAKPQLLGTFDLSGEIVDSKCFLGVMNPGNGKVHRDCAARCLSGGIPLALVTQDFRGKPAFLLLLNEQRKPLKRKYFLRIVGQPVTISGQVLKSGDTLYLVTDGYSTTELP
jgi:hypothetical protein